MEVDGTGGESRDDDCVHPGGAVEGVLDVQARLPGKLMVMVAVVAAVVAAVTWCW